MEYSDAAVIGQVEDVVNEIRWKLSVNAVKLFKVRNFKIESCQTDSMKTMNPRVRIQHGIGFSHEDSFMT
jgi:rRNA maturation endonuclease Nob1